MKKSFIFLVLVMIYSASAQPLEGSLDVPLIKVPELLEGAKKVGEFPVFAKTIDLFKLNLDINETISYNLTEGDVVVFKLNNTEHKISVLDIKGPRIIFGIDGKQVKIMFGTFERFDFNDDKWLDLYVEYEAYYTSVKSEVQFKHIHEKMLGYEDTANDWKWTKSEEEKVKPPIVTAADDEPLEPESVAGIDNYVRGSASSTQWFAMFILVIVILFSWKALKGEIE